MGIQAEKKPKGHTSGLIGVILTFVYVAFLFFSAPRGLNFAPIASHVFCVIIAACFSLPALFAHKGWGMFTCCALMIAAAVLLPISAHVVIPSAILFFVSFLRMNNWA